MGLVSTSRPSRSRLIGPSSRSRIGHAPTFVPFVSARLMLTGAVKGTVLVLPRNTTVASPEANSCPFETLMLLIVGTTLRLLTLRAASAFGEARAVSRHVSPRASPVRPSSPCGEMILRFVMIFFPWFVYFEQ